jgi:peptide-methionine (S)-S-oxide reductase
MHALPRTLAASTFALLALLAYGCSGCGGGVVSSSGSAEPAGGGGPSATGEHEMAEAPHGGSPLEPPPRAGLAIATFAGGCFWCMEAPFERLPGVGAVISGYTGGPEVGPTYEQVGSGETGHAEAVRIVYDPALITYEQLLDVFWHQIDPTTVDQSFVDTGPQYRTAIYVHTPEQRAAAEASKRALTAANRFGAPIVTTIEDAGPFYRAEEYHQDFYRTTPGRYQSYRRGSGRDAYIDRIWGAGTSGH